MPPIAVATVAILCGNAIAQSSSAILTSGLQVVLAVALLHTSGFFFGYMLSRMLRIDVSSSRTISIEVGMQVKPKDFQKHNFSSQLLVLKLWCLFYRTRFLEWSLRLNTLGTRWQLCHAQFPACATQSLVVRWLGFGDETSPRKIETRNKMHSCKANLSSFLCNWYWNLGSFVSQQIVALAIGILIWFFVVAVVSIFYLQWSSGAVKVVSKRFISWIIGLFMFISWYCIFHEQKVYICFFITQK